MRCSKYAMSVTLFAILLVTSAERGFSADVELPSRDDFHIYLLMGQSNMAGRGKVDPAANQPHPRVLKLDKQNAWVPATDPLHFDKPKIAGVGPGSGFGPAMADADESITIGLVPCSFGGTPLQRWEKGGDLYEGAIRRAQIAAKHGTIKGVIWHQGESDSRMPETANTYGKRLAGMVVAMRKDLSQPMLPVVVGKLGEFIKADRLAHTATVNKALGDLPKMVPGTACVESTGLKAKSDGIHFDAKSAREFGRRYAKAMLELQKQEVKQTAAAAPSAGSKLDDGIDKDPDARYPIFVRMTDQLFRKGGDYEAFANEHNSDKRSVLRKMVLASLRKNADASWNKVEKRVADLKSSGLIGAPVRFWIVNGFACDATFEACEQLAASDAVEFVYLQRGPTRQHARSRIPAAQRKQLVEQQQAVYKPVADGWKDDAETAFSTEGLEIPWNVKRIGADVAWTKEKATGKGVVVGLIDSGLMVTPSLTAALWKNPKEELDGKDNDGNGYVDDLFGYDFSADSFYALGDGARLTHGSMCGGIIAGRPNNKAKLATGIAPRARLMVLRGMGLLKAYEYALANGADIVSMSYMFVSTPLGNYRGVYRLAHEHMAAGGIVAVGGAGNFARLPKGKQIAVPKDIPCVIAAAGIVENGSKAPASSEGPCYWNGVKFYDDYPPTKPLEKPDVTGCFGGYPVWGRPFTAGGRWKIHSQEGDNFALVVGPQGNSFSGPHAAGVAALMLSANPELNAWEVKELMERTCKDIGDKGRDSTFGAGLLQAAEAVRAAKQVKK